MVASNAPAKFPLGRIVARGDRPRGREGLGRTGTGGGTPTFILPLSTRGGTNMPDRNPKVIDICRRTPGGVLYWI